MNEDLIEKIAAFVERQCPRKMFPGERCSEYNCSVHWTAAQIRNRKFEDIVSKPASYLHPAIRVDVMR